MRIFFGKDILFDRKSVLLSESDVRDFYGFFEDLNVFVHKPFEKIHLSVGILSGHYGQNDLYPVFSLVDDHVLYLFDRAV